MPIVPPGFPSDIFYSTAEILNIARVLVNDCQGGLAGQDLADSRPYTWVILNLAYAKLANWLEDTNVESATYAEWTITLPVNAGSQDPAAQSRLGYDGFVDEAGNFYDQPTLQQNMLQPLDLSARTSGINQPYVPMKQKLGGLGAQYGTGPYIFWEFRENSVFILGGSSAITDIKVRGIPAIPELVQPTVDNPNPPIIYFAKAGEALAYMVAAEFQEIRGALNAVQMRAKANEQLQILSKKAAKRENRTSTRMRGYNFGNRRGGRRPYVVLG